MRYALLAFPLLLLLAGAAAAEACADCHNPGNASGNYVFDPPSIVLNVPPAVSPGDDFSISVSIVSPGQYEVGPTDVEMVLDHSFSGTFTQSGSDDGGEVTLGFSGLPPGSCDYTLDVEYEVYFKHTNGGNPNSALYKISRSGRIIFDDLALSVSTGTMVFDQVGQVHTVIVNASGDAYDIMLEKDRSISGLISVSSIRTRMGPGETATISVTLLNRIGAEGNLTLSWYADGGIVELPILIVVVPEPEEDGGVGIFHELGKYLGIASLVLLLVGYFTGGTGALKDVANNIFGSAAKRVKFHCALSYEVLALSVFHLAVLIYGPYSRPEQYLSWQVSLGFIALFIMIVISVNGIFQKRLVRAMGYQNWRRVHSWGSYIATALVVVHALLIGSHFGWFRGLFGPV